MDHDPVFGIWLQRRRKALGLTQRALGECAGCSAATVRKIEADERRPSRAVATKMAACLGLEGDEVADFLRFARGGWADDAPAPPPPPPELPRPDAGGDPPPEPPAFLEDEDPPAARSGPFVARVEALSWLEGHLEAARDGRGGVAFVAGESGNGKTSLLTEFSRRAQAAYPDLIVARGLCNAFAGSGDPYLPFRDALTMLCGDVESRWAAGAVAGDHARRLWRFAPVTLAALREHGHDLVGIVAPLGSVRLAAGAAATDSPEPAPVPRSDLPQPQLFEQLTAVLRHLAAQRPLLLLLDDLQWADRGSVGMLFHLARRLTGSRVLVVGAYRSDEVPLTVPEAGGSPHPLAAVVQESRRLGGDVVLSLDRRGPIGGRAFVDALLDSETNGLDEAFRNELTRRTEGHPLFTVELLRDLQARGDLMRDGTGRWYQGPALDWDTLPARVEAVIEQRLGRLDPALRELLTVASVEGEIFTAEVLARAQHADDLDILRILDRDLGARHRLVTEDGDLRSGQRILARYRFAHALFQQYLYRGLGRARRRLLHAEIAAALEEVLAREDEEASPQIGLHYLQAGDSGRAAPFLERAGDRAKRLFALEEAADLYRDAADAFGDAQPLARARCLGKHGESCWLQGLGNSTRSLGAYREAFELFTAAGETLEAARMQRLTGRLYWELSDRTTSMMHYRRSLELAEREPESPELAMIISSLSQMHMLADEGEAALREGERALEIAERLDLPEVRLHALNNMGIAAGYLGDPEGGQAMLRESLTLARTLGLTHDTCRAMTNLAELLYVYGRLEESQALTEEMQAYAERTRNGLFRPAAVISLAEIDWRRGRWGRARSRMRALHEREGENLMGYHIQYATLVEARMATMLQRPDEALTILRRIVHLLAQSDELQFWIPYWVERLRAHDALAQPAEAGAAVDELIGHLDRRLASGSGMRYFAAIATALCWLLEDRAGRATPPRMSLTARLERAVAIMGTPESRACLAEVRGLAARADGALDEAVAQLQAALDIWNEAEWPVAWMRVSTRLAETRAAAGDAAAARELRAAVARRHGALVDDLRAGEPATA